MIREDHRLVCYIWSPHLRLRWYSILEERQCYGAASDCIPTQHRIRFVVWPCSWRVILHHDLLSSYLVPSHQRGLGHKVWDHEPTNHPWNGNYEPGSRRQHYELRLLHAFHDCCLCSHVHWCWSNIKLQNRHGTRNVDWLSSHLRLWCRLGLPATPYSCTNSLAY